MQGEAPAAQHVSQHSEDPETPFSFFACEVCVCIERDKEINLVTQLCINLEYKGKNPGARCEGHLVCPSERLSVPPPAFVSPLGLRLALCLQHTRTSAVQWGVSHGYHQLPTTPQDAQEHPGARHGKMAAREGALSRRAASLHPLLLNVPRGVGSF